jgi:hypothetical protein
MLYVKSKKPVYVKEIDVHRISLDAYDYTPMGWVNKKYKRRMLEYILNTRLEVFFCNNTMPKYLICDKKVIDILRETNSIGTRIWQ